MQLPPTPARRRTWLLAGVGAAAAAAGIGAAWWRTRLREPADEVVASLYRLSFDSPAGAPLDMARFRGQMLVINFWATWCPPCVEEMPMLDAFYRQQAAKGWQMVGLAIDQPSSVRQFLARTPVSYPIGLAGLGGTDLGKAMGNSSGALPFTVVIHRDGVIAQRRLGKVNEPDLAAWRALG